MRVVGFARATSYLTGASATLLARLRYLNPVTAPIMKLVFRGWFKKYKKILETRGEQTAPQPTAAAQPRV